MEEYEYIQKLSGYNAKISGYLGLKRFFDVVVSLILLIPGSILILIFGILIKLETPGKMFYSQERVGIMGKPIYITKLRSMFQDAEKKSGAMWAVKNDARVTKVGSFIRKTRIDELPQLFSVLKGDLSLIGPRPERPVFTEEFSKNIPNFEQRLFITPGLSGWAQVNGGYDATPAEKLVDDLYYIEHVSAWMDFRILWMTIKVVLTGHGAR
ncbi:sugar transferase [Leuconostoc holzapfelii]|uniref:Sugar transferase n=1 Tax=Leuconostoc holzapfelii TaxID=434464 RepID=A0A846ZDZ4_9LACO|nr:sugar transferase [Leuconostoc holzapfelii]NKZ18254.1 sugar transferase [Leuconostoc holzapfelii]